MDDIEESIEFKEVELGEGSKLKISLKSLTNRKFVDVRKWQKYPNLEHFIPTKKGIMVSLKDWKQVIAVINAFIAEYGEEELAKAA